MMETEQASVLGEYEPDDFTPTEHTLHRDSCEFEELGRDDIRFGTVITDECQECGYVRQRVEHSVTPQYESVSEVNARSEELVEGIEMPMWAIDHVAYMRQRFAVLPTEAEAREYADRRFGGIHGDYRLSRVRRPEVLCLYEPRTERAVGTGLLPSADHRRDGESAFHNPTVGERFEQFLNPAPHVIVNGAQEDARFAPDGYDGTQLDWHLDQLRTLEVRVQTPDILLD